MELYSSTDESSQSVLRNLQGLRSSYAQKGLALIGYSIEQDKESFEQYVSSLNGKLPYDARLFDQISTQKLKDGLKRFGVDWNGALPLFILLDSDGEPLMSFSGIGHVEALEKHVATLFEQAQ